MTGSTPYLMAKHRLTLTWKMRIGTTVKRARQAVFLFLATALVANAALWTDNYDRAFLFPSSKG